MTIRPRNSVAPVILSTALLFSALAGCQSSDGSEGSGSGGTGPSGTGGGSGNPGMGGDQGVGGTPFMSRAGADSGTCKKTDEACDRTSDCCAGNLCNRNGPTAELNGCKVACVQNSECSSGCCYLFIGGNNGGFCAPAQWCSCGGTGAACSSSLPACCNTHMCQGGVCNPMCTQNAECATQCCVPLPGIPNVKTCVDRMYCPS